MDRELVWRQLRTYAKRAVRIACTDGEIIEAELIAAVEDADGSRSVLYEVLTSNRPEKYQGRNKSAAWSTDFDGIASVEATK